MKDGLTPRSRTDRSCPVTEAAGALYLLFLLATALAPLDFGQPLPQPALERMFVVTFGRVAWAELAANTVLYAPFGALARRLLVHRRPGIPLASVVALGFAAVVSVGVEAVQAFSPTRVSSVVDVAANVSGAALGVLVSRLAERMSRRRQIQFWRLRGERPLELRAKFYVLLLTVIAAAPYSFSLDPLWVERAWNKAVPEPFDEYLTGGAAGGSLEAQASERRRVQTTALDDGAETAAFVMLAWVVFSCLRREYRFGAAGAALLTLWTVAALAIGFSVMQFLIVNRGFVATDLVIRGCGGCAGLLAAICRGRGAPGQDDAAWPCGRRTARVLALAIVGYIVLRGSFPLMLRPASLFPDLASLETVFPFFGYARGRFDLAITDLVAKTYAYLLLGTTLVAAGASNATSDARRTTARSAAAALGVAIVVEGLQVFIVSRVPSITDLLLAAPAAALGAYLMCGLQSAVREAGILKNANKGNLPPLGGRRWTLSDALISQLVDASGDSVKPLRQ
ncbi:MAG: hypothetical protein FLDDKLPJ_02121 [Phycisphaerae bacterium]|nr:hypothetical protein [Phycisphaerae bacterium]